MKSLTFANVTMAYDKHHKIAAVNNLQCTIAAKSVQVWLGPSGSGKTTAALIAMGIISPDVGAILIDGKDITKMRPHKRSRVLEIYYVFQQPSLYPHIDVLENLRFGISKRIYSRSEFESAINMSLDLMFPDYVGKDRNRLLAKKPNELSGGEKQRVSLSKAFVRKPQIAIFDEPLSSVDAPLRIRIRRGLRQWQKDNGITCIWITHDQQEALTIADTIAVFHGGRILQVDNPDVLTTSPSSKRVAEFIGEGINTQFNFLRGELVDRHSEKAKFVCASGPTILFKGLEAHTKSMDFDREILCGISSQNFELCSDQRIDSFDCEVRLIERSYQGHTIVADCNGDRLAFRTDNGDHLRESSTVRIRPKDDALLFSANDGSLLQRVDIIDRF